MSDHYAPDRPATEPCQAGTVGCCVNHTGPGTRECEAW